MTAPCPGENPCPDHRKTKAELIGELQAARDQVAAARDLLRAIAGYAQLPYPDWGGSDCSRQELHYQTEMRTRLDTISIRASLSESPSSESHVYNIRAQLLRTDQARELPYRPVKDEPAVS
jgi:hypothetical protein